MSVPTNCSSCGMELYTNPPIREIKCEKCEENDHLKNTLYTLLYMRMAGESDIMLDIITDSLNGLEVSEQYQHLTELGKEAFNKYYRPKA